MYARVSYIILSLLLLVSCQEKRMDRFEREAREYTETHCPQRMEDGLTVLDSMVFEQTGENGNLKLYYSLPLTDEQRATMMGMLDELGETNLKVVRNSVFYAKHKDAGIDFTYIYHDANKGDKIVEYHFTKEDYQ